MALTNEQITAQNFKDFYGQIRPYLNGNVPTFANTFSKSDLYSTDEVLIGRWIDGKPLYQKVINCGATPSRACTFPHGISNLETVVLLRGIGRINERWDFLPYPTPDSITYQVRLDILKSSNVRFSYGSGADLYQEVYVIIQYTKSTDSSMSITDGNEYSTDEQVVGKWIDGKPVYQKTIDLGVLPNTDQKLIPHGISNLKMVCSYNGAMYGTISGSYSSLPLPNVGTNNQYAYDVAFNIRDNDLVIVTQADRTWLRGIMTIRYTKTTD